MAAPRPAKDLKPIDARTKLLKKMQQDKLRRDAQQFNKQAKTQDLSKKVGPAKDVTKGSLRSKFLSDAKAGNIKAATPKPVFATTPQSGLLGKIGSKIPLVGLAIDMVANAQPAGSPQERSWERRNTEQRRMKGKVSGMGFTGSGKLNPDVPKRKSAGTYSGYGNGTSSAAYGYKAKSKTIMPSVSMAGGGVNRPTVKKAGDGGPKKKTGATTSAAPAKPKRKSHFQRRMAERYAIGSSGKSL